MGTKKKFSLSQKQNISGWIFLTPATFLIAIMSFYPMIRAVILSMQTGVGAKIRFSGLSNYKRMFSDAVFMQSLKNTFIYLIVQVPIMLLFALLLASLLNDKHLRFKGLFRTTSLVSYAIIFRSLFAVDGYVNNVLIHLGILHNGYNFLSNPVTARIVIIIALLWRWTGYNMVFYLAGLQNIEYSIYEAAKIDGATYFQILRKITIPLLKPMILLTAIMSTEGIVRVCVESVTLTGGGPANATITMSHYIYNSPFKYVPNFGYSAAMSFLILILVAVLAAIQMKVGDKRD